MNPIIVGKNITKKMYFQPKNSVIWLPSKGPAIPPIPTAKVIIPRPLPFSLDGNTARTIAMVTACNMDDPIEPIILPISKVEIFVEKKHITRKN